MELNHLTQLEPRDAWPNEATNFTPWLAQDENFQVLAKTLHLFDADVEGIEHTIGAFSADILARDREGYVLIENQLEQTDHTHLGQLITYVAGLDEPAKVIWLSTKVREEHRAAIDWLNDQTTDDFSFFAVELELVRIGQSAAAPLFHVVAKPNYWSRHVARQSRQVNSHAPTERQTKYFELWTAFAAFLDDVHPGLRGNTPPKGHWWQFPIGRSGFHLTVTAGGRDQWIGTEIYFQNDPENLIIEYFSANKENFRTYFSQQLFWDAGEDRKGSRVAVRWDNIDPFDQARWPEMFAWYYDNMQAFRNAFADEIRELRIDNLRAEISRV